MSQTTNRRRFLQTTAVSGLGFWVAGGVLAQESKSANAKIAMASIGIGGKGGGDSGDAARFGDMVAICDVDENTLNAGAGVFLAPSGTTTFARCSTRWARASTRSP